MKASTFARMSLARKPEQVYYVPPRCRYKATERETSLPDDQNRSNNITLCQDERPDSKPYSLDESKKLTTSQNDSFRSLADRLDTLTVKDPLRRSTSSVGGSTIIMTNRNSGSHSRQSKPKKLPTLQAYVPPHKRNQNSNVGESSQQSTASAEIDPTEDRLFAEDINIDPFTNFRKTRRSDPYIYRQLLPIDYINDDEIIEQLSHVIEVSNIDPSFKEIELLQELKLTSSEENVDIRWVSDTSALLAFPNSSMADCLLRKHSSLLYIGSQNTCNDLETGSTSDLKLFPLMNASLSARKKAFAISEELKTKAETEVRNRPETTNLVARQFIGRHLGRSDILPGKSELRQCPAGGKFE